MSRTPDVDPDVAVAVDPVSTPDALRAVLRARPDLRAVVVANPACPPELRDEVLARAAAGAPEPAVTSAAEPAPAVTSAAEPAPAVTSAAEPTPAVTSEPGPASAPDAQPVPEPAPKRSPRRTAARAGRRRRGLLVPLAVVALVAGAFAGGTVVGWQAQAQRQTAVGAPTPAPTVTLAVPRYSSDGAPSMPDVRGLVADDALQVLADAGIDTTTVRRTTRPAAGPAGVVVDQTPAFGTTSPGTVELVVSTAAKVPDVVGKASEDVVKQLTVLGADVTTEPRYVAGATVGTVVGVSPGVGKALSGSVTVQVAEAPAAVYVDALDAVSGGCSSGSGSVDGTTYDHTLECSTGSADEPAETAWVVGRHADRFEAVVGIPDDADPGDRAKVVVLADGKVVATVEVAYGKTHQLSADVTGALRLTVRAVSLSSSDDWSTPDVALGSARLVGSSGEIAKLGDGSP